MASVPATKKKHCPQIRIGVALSACGFLVLVAAAWLDTQAALDGRAPIRRVQVSHPYPETGVASWYGEPYHGRRTANGEVYDMSLMTAAHRTLPLPSYVRVTNLENARSVVLRVNDRGPFIDGRIIDVSLGAAQILGFVRQGLVRVQVDEVVDAK